MNYEQYKYSFYDDYSEGAHPRILEALGRTNLKQEPGYGNDSLCEDAAQIMKENLGGASSDIHFVSAGTQSNLIAFAAMLRPYESVIAPLSGHIAIHEAGAVEATGHKINVVSSNDGKLTPNIILAVLEEHTDEHMVKPKAVFISQATEVGTIYTKSEIEALSELCQSKGLYLYLDGARLGSALMSREADITLQDLANLVDMFYIGGTKNGALLGEVVVINNPTLKENFRYHLKQRGALLAKGRVLGVQFMELFKDGLYYELARHANDMATKLTMGIKNKGYNLLSESTTNQIFPILPHDLIDGLKQYYGFYVWKKVDNNNSAIRLVTSWATPESAVADFLSDLK